MEYYNPAPTVTEWNDYRAVHCGSETCQRFEQEIEIELLVENIDGRLEYFVYTCTECDTPREFTIEIGNPQSYYYTD